MSLINQVLRDLERRQAGDTPATAGSPSLLYAPPRRPRRVWPYLLVLAGTVAYWLFGEQAFLQWENKPQAIASAKLAPPAPKEAVAVERTPSSQVPPQAVAPIPAAAESPPVPNAHSGAGAQASRLPDLPHSAAFLRQASPEPSRRVSPEPAKERLGEVPKAVSPTNASEGQAGRLRSQGEPPPSRKAEPAKPPPLPPRPAVLRPAGEDAEGLFRRAARLAAEGETGQAKAMLERALREQPSHSQARVLLGRLLIQQGDWAAAAAALLNDGATPAAEANNELAQLRARVLLQQNQTEQAVAVLENARAHAPADGKTLGTLGAAYHAQGRYAEAAAAYRQALRLQPAEPRWWLGLAVALDGNKQAAEALPAYREVVARGGLEERVLSYARERLKALEASAAR